MYAYNPRKKTPEQLESSLVGADRHDILNGIMAELALKEGEAPKQHWMIVGARGMGKSHLLTLLYHKVCDNSGLNSLWIPVLFPEEIRMAGDLARFLERAATEILHDLERNNNPIAPGLKEKIARIRGIRHDERVAYLFSVITWIRSETGRHILLIAENLQQLLGKKISLIDQKKLRAYLQSEDALLLIGSATTIFDALHDHSHPFYHFFHIRRLNELSFDDIKRLVTDLLSGCGREEQARIMLKNEARLKVLHAFTGGNPRMAVFLSDILKTDVNEEMIDIMDRILDELTPYFEAIINDTPEYLQEIINALAAYEPAQSPKEIAEHLEMEQGTVRNYLKQAKDGGYVRVAFSKGKSNFYCLNEYLYRTWFQMRDSSHREEMRWLMELMLLLYSKEQLAEEHLRIEQSGGSCANHYQRLVQQTYDFMLSNPAFCAVIDLCAQQCSKKKRTIKAYHDWEKKLKSEMTKKFKALDGDKLSKRQYFARVMEIVVDTTATFVDSPLTSLATYSQTIPAYYIHTSDINKTLRDYDEKLVPIINNHFDELVYKVGAIPDNKEYLKMVLSLNIALDDYDTAFKIAQTISDDTDKSIIDTTIALLIIQITYYGHTNRIDKMIRSYEALKNINQIIKGTGSFFRLFFAMILAYAVGAVTDKIVTKLVNHATSTSQETILMNRMWTCIQEPGSEAAQKMLADPSIAQMVDQLKSLMANAAEQKNSLPLE
jgi:hypothetical protein